MASLTKYAGTISQTTGGKYRTFSDLNNLKNNVEGSWANSNGNIKGKSSSPNRPSTLSFTNFGFNLPTGAEVSKIVITYRHKKTGSLSIGAPTISLLGIGGFSSKAVAPKTSMETHTKSFYADGSKNNNLISPTTNKVTRSTVNSSSFGVKVNYPANTNTSEGTMSISYVKVTVEYKVPKYALTLKKVSGGYNEESYTVEASISNTNLTGYNPTVTLTAPTGFSFDSFDGSGEYTKVSPTVISWNPQFTSKVPSSTALFKFDVDVTYPSGQSSYTGTFTLSESLYSSSKSLSATITDRPSGSGSESEDYPYDEEINTQYEPDKPYRVPVWDNDPFPEFGTEAWSDINKYINVTGPYLKIDTRQDTAPHYVKTVIHSNKAIWIIYENGSQHNGYTLESIGTKYGDRNIIYSKDVLTANFTVQVSFGDTSEGPWELIREMSFTVDFVPTTSMVDEFDTPYFTVLEPSEEEYNRLGDGYTYIAQSDINHTTTDTAVRDWHKNNRIGVFNGPITNNTTEEDIFENTTYWSKATGGLNEYHNCECEFTYDSQYPLYILVTGDYPEAEDYGYDMGSIKYDTPCIVEKQVYNSREASGNYPVPINALLDNEEPSVITLSPNESTKGTILYDLPLEDDFGTNEDYAIRGIQVRADIDSTDNLVIYAKIHSPSGEIGQRSIVLNGNEEEIVIGDLGDLWGFTTLQLTQLDDWELELSASNLLNNGDSEIVFNNANITFYLETVEKQQIRVIIDGEDLAYYGAFIENVDIPEGLETPPKH